MRGWVRTDCMVGVVMAITWGFQVAGLHTPMSFAASLVGTVGFALIWGCLWHAWDSFERAAGAGHGEGHP